MLVKVYHCGLSKIDQFDFSKGVHFGGINSALEAKNSSNIKVNRANINNCNKGIRLENCWGSELTNINIGSFSEAFFIFSVKKYLSASITKIKF